MAKIRFWLIALFLLIGNLGCGPTNKEAARAVILVSPVVLAIGFGIGYGLHKLWQRRWPEVSIDRRPCLILVTVLTCAACILGMKDEPGLRVWEWAVAALWLFGTSYLTLFLLCWRVWLRVRREYAFTWAAPATMAFMVAPAFPIGLDLLSGAPVDIALGMWILPGYLGAISGPLLLSAVLEAWLRNRTGTQTPVADNQEVTNAPADTADTEKDCKNSDGKL